MKFLIKFLIIICLFGISLNVSGQNDIPEEPEFISASVIPDSDPLLIELKWSPSISLDVTGYIIYVVNNNITETVDTVWGRFTTIYSYTYPHLNYSPERFRIAAISEGYRSSITDPHTTMILNYEYEKCNIEVTLKWTQYIGWKENILSYHIYRKLEGGTYERIASVNGDSLQYIDSNLQGAVQYYYYVEAVGINNKTSTSNSINLFTDSYLRPSRLLTDFVTVEDQLIKVKFLLDENAEVDHYLIQRSDSVDGTFITLEKVPNTKQVTYLYEDRKVDVNNTIYYYRIVSIDPCGNQTAVSNVSSNILLNGRENSFYENFLYWTPYQSWNYGIAEYRIYNKYNLNQLLVETSDAELLEYNHDIKSYIEEAHKNKIYLTNKMCYYIEAIENGYDDYVNVNTSRSNVVCINKKPEIYIPTAFNPVAHTIANREFKPVLSFYEEGTYEIFIFDRWGEVFFNTKDVYEGWNGYLRDKLAPSQRYQYLIRYKDFSGALFEKAGIFFLIAK